MSKATLPADPPDRGADRHELLAWATIACGREHDPFIGVTRYGVNLAARLVIHTRGGSVAVRVRDLLGANGLPGVMLAYDGSTMPAYTGPQCQLIVSRLIWSAEASIRDDDRATMLGDLGRFLSDCLRHETPVVGTYDDQCAFAFIDDLDERNRRHRRAPAVLGVDEQDSGRRLWVPRVSLLQWIRETRTGTVDPGELRAELEQLGWVWVTAHRRSPEGWDRRVKLPAWVIPFSWEDSPIDLHYEVAKALGEAPPDQEVSAGEASQ